MPMPVREREVESEVAERGRRILLIRRSPASSTFALSLFRSVARSLARWHVFSVVPTHACCTRSLANFAVRLCLVVLKPRALTLAPILDETSRFEEFRARVERDPIPDPVNRKNLYNLWRVNILAVRFRHILDERGEATYLDC